MDRLHGEEKERERDGERGEGREGRRGREGGREGGGGQRRKVGVRSVARVRKCEKDKEKIKGGILYMYVLFLQEHVYIPTESHQMGVNSPN